ncbi:MAG: serine protease [Pseudonocardiaceae bacterium]
MRIRTAVGPGRTVAVTLAVLAAGVFAAPASAAPQFAPAAVATVHPGVVTDTQGNQCTSNFVFTNGSRVFIGQAAHCAGTGPATATNGCEAQTRPLGTPVAVAGASRPGTLVYSSWIAMQQGGEQDPSTCQFNDFALVELDPSDVAATNPSVPFFGGPTGLDTDGTAPGEQVHSYGNSPLRGGIGLLSPKSGVSAGTVGEGWGHEVITVTPGIPGDSGSGFVSADGSAFGVLSTLALAPVPGSNGVADLARALEYANDHGGLGTVTLVAGTEPFRAQLIPLGR